MGMTSLTLAWMLLVAGPAQTADVVPITKRNFRDPDPYRAGTPADDQAAQALRLAQPGRQDWEESASRTPDQDHFAYYAPADGIYWFTVAVVDQQNNEQPPSPHKVPPNQKILVDTAIPDIKITSLETPGRRRQRQLGNQGRQRRPGVDALRVPSRRRPGPRPVVCRAGDARTHGPGTLPRGRPRRIAVRIEMKDYAGNLGTMTKELPAAAPVERLTSAPPAPTPAVLPPPAPVAAPLVAAAPAPPAPLPGRAEDDADAEHRGARPSTCRAAAIRWCPPRVKRRAHRRRLVPEHRSRSVELAQLDPNARWTAECHGDQ